MLYTLIKRVGFKELIKHPKHFLSLFDLLFEKNSQTANTIFLEIAKSHQKLLQSKNLKQRDKLLNFLCDLHLQNHSALNSGVYSEYSWMYSKFEGKIWVSRAWIWAIQAELGLNLIPNELLFIDLEKNKHLEYANFVHYIHKATYDIIELKGIQPTFSVIYRNVIDDQRVFVPKGKIASYGQIEYNVIKLGDFVNIRCCSLKPHACENYDFTVSDQNLFVVARGMEELAYGQFRTAMPTVLFTFNHQNISRFKSNADYKDVLVLNMDHVDKFLYLYEP